MDIYLTERNNKKARFRFPSLPEEVEVSKGAKYQSYSVIGKGDTKIPKGTEVEVIKWDGVFFGKTKRKEALIKVWISPTKCKKQLSKWMESGTVLRLMVTGTSINCDVTISRFFTKEYGAYGSCSYSIELCRYDKLVVYTSNELGLGNKKKKLSGRPSSDKPKNYKVVKGDSLWKISKKFYSTGTKWEKIYNANKTKIEKTAKKHGKKNSSHGHWIWPGEILIIP